MKKAVSLLVLMLIFAIGDSFGQSTYNFLKLDVSARAAALGGSFVSNNDDPDVIFYNPAGIGLLKENPASFSFTKYLLDINMASLSYSTNLKNIGRIGAGVKYINYGSFPKTDESGNVLGSYGAQEVAFIAGYSNLLDKNFYYGANAKFIFSNIADRSSSAIALDLGLHYEIPSDLIDIGFAVLNAGTQLSSYYNTKEELPLDVVLGVSKRMEHMPVRLSLDFHNLNENQTQALSRLKFFTIGAEFYLSRVLNLRFGFDNQRRRDLTIGTSAGLAGFNVGLGVKISSYQFNYGFSSFGLVGGLHRISISTNL